jgi:AraC-like DNA-binding protein
MNEKVIPVTKVLEDSFVYSCTFKQQRGHEQFVPYHVLAFQFSGETYIQHQNGRLVLKKNQIILAQKNQLTKSIKIPAADKIYKSISVIMTDAALQKYAADNSIHEIKKYTGEKNILLKPNSFVKSYFQSLLPYIQQSKKISKKLATIKTNEAIELLLHLKPSLKSFLFDFSEPYKIDLEKFMLQNYHYNVPVEHFAKLTGRSLATFKRDFGLIFQTSPRKWLKEKRLTEAYHLIEQKKRKPTEIYLELGFENLSHFYTSFKQKFGTTPAESLAIKNEKNEHRTKNPGGR